MTGISPINPSSLDFSIIIMVSHSYPSRLMESQYLRFTSDVSLLVLHGLPVRRLTLISFVADLGGVSNANFTPSAVISINGQDIKSITQFGREMQDLDALYNSVFYNPVTIGTQNGSGSFEESLFTQHSDTTSCTFENGTTAVVSATAEIGASDATAIPADGQSFFRLLTAAGLKASSNSSFASPKKPSSPSVLPSPLPLGPHYPDPFVKSYQNYISGYFMNGTDNSDLAVLSVASFNLTDLTDSTEFLKVSSTFLAKCASAGKKRLIVDVRNNPGGLVYVGYALFQQLFPNVLPYSGVRMRGSDAANALGQIASKIPPSDDTTDLTNSVFNAQTLLRGQDGPSFDSWQQFYGPLKQYNDLFSNIGSWNYITSNSSSETAALTSNTSIVPPQVFASDAITLVSSYSDLPLVQNSSANLCSSADRWSMLIDLCRLFQSNDIPRGRQNRDRRWTS